MTAHTSAPSENLNASIDAASATSTRAHNLAIVIMLFGAAILALYKLGAFPIPWFDEGWWLQIPKNLALTGNYATYSVEGYRPFDTIISASPAFFVPAAVAFKVFGVGLMQGRLMVALSFLVSCVLVHFIARRLYGPTIALIALLLFILARPDDDFTSVLMLSRQFMPEVPALCSLLAAMYLLISALSKPFGTATARPSIGMLIVSGLLFGLAMTIKSQFMLVVLPTLVLLGAMDLIYYRRGRSLIFVIPILMGLAMIGLNQLFIYALLGSDNYARFMADLSAAAEPQVRALFRPAAMLNAVKFFARSPYAVLALAATAYALLGAVDRSAKNSGMLLVALFVGIWMLWYSFATVAWSRYAFPGLAVSSILIANLLGNVVNGSVTLPTRLAAALRKHADISRVPRWLRVMAVGLTLFGASFETAKTWMTGAFGNDTYTASDMAAYIDTHLPNGAIVETWEWEVAFFSTTSRFHHPPTSLLPSLIATRQLGEPLAPDTYDYMQAQPTHVLVGPFGLWTNLYRTNELDQRASLEANIGVYRLYRLPDR